jgi:hypothetical protein
MIGKITTGRSFRGCLLYCLNDKQQQLDCVSVMKGRAEVIWSNQCGGNERELVAQFEAVRQLNPKLSKPVWHITLSLAPGEELSRDKLIEMSEQCAGELGFEKNQWVAVHHRDTGHQHLHLVANRVGFDGKTVSDSNSYKKVAAYCRKMEVKYNLQPVLSPRRFLSQEQRQLPRLDQRKVQMRQDVGECIAVSRSYDEFERLMKEKKYEVLKARGIAFRDEKTVYVKGSELGYSLGTIQRLLEQNKVRFEKSLSPCVQWGEKEQKIAQKAAGLTASEKKAVRQKGNDLPGNAVANRAANVLKDLLKPEQMSDQLPRELTHEQKKKRRGLHH